MTRFEQQGQIYEEIQRLQSELDVCPHGSPEYLPLLRQLNAALKAYNAIPSDDSRRREINARLDQIQSSPPSAENTAEFFALCQELRDIPRPAVSRPSARQKCFQLRHFIWMDAALLCLASLFLAPSLSYTYGAGVWIISVFATVATLAWAVWSSTYRP